MAQRIIDVSIVGGGPAGAYLGLLLAQRGIHVTIFDHSHPREKPCGGGISPFALRRFPILGEVPRSYRFVDTMLFISPRGRRAKVTGQSGMNVSREHLDGFLLEKAKSSGAEIVTERVTSVKEGEGSWLLATRNGEFRSRTVVGADGVSSIVRRATVGRIGNENLAACAGYFATGVERDYSTIRFLEDRNGYAWIFPRETHSSIGVIVDLPQARNVKQHLDDFVEEYCPSIHRLAHFGALVPAIRSPKFYDIPCSGENWILIGDAAGHVDPILKEGMRYAMWSAELAAEAIADGNPANFDRLWRRAYYRNLAAGCRLLKYFYHPRMLEFNIAMASRSRACENLLASLVADEQNYRGLKRRFLARLPTMVYDGMIGWLRKRGPTPQAP